MTFTTGEPENNSNYSWYTLDSFLVHWYWYWYLVLV
jgi:hypothetical protein